MDQIILLVLDEVMFLIMCGSKAFILTTLKAQQAHLKSHKVEAVPWPAPNDAQTCLKGEEGLEAGGVEGVEAFCAQPHGHQEHKRLPRGLREGQGVAGLAGLLLQAPRLTIYLNLGGRYGLRILEYSARVKQ